MKYAIFYIILFFTFQLNAQNASLLISLHDSSLFISELNGIAYNDPSTEMGFHGLNDGKQKLKIVKLMKLGNSEVQKPVFDGIIDLSANRTTKAIIDPMNQFKIVDLLAIEPKKDNYSNRSYYWIPDARRIEKNQQPVTNQQGMNNNQFAGMLENLREINNEGDRYQSAVGLISISTMSCNQLAEMMLTFQEEDYRIRLADQGQNNVSDPQNFDIVYNALRYPSSVRRLHRRTN